MPISNIMFHSYNNVKQIGLIADLSVAQAVGIGDVIIACISLERNVRCFKFDEFRV